MKKYNSPLEKKAKYRNLENMYSTALQDFSIMSGGAVCEYIVYSLVNKYLPENDVMYNAAGVFPILAISTSALLCGFNSYRYRKKANRISDEDDSTITNVTSKNYTTGKELKNHFDYVLENLSDAQKESLKVLIPLVESETMEIICKYIEDNGLEDFLENHDYKLSISLKYEDEEAVKEASNNIDIFVKKHQ